MMYNFVKRAVVAMLTSCVIVFICILINLASEYALWAVAILTVLILLEQKEGDGEDV